MKKKYLWIPSELAIFFGFCICSSITNGELTATTKAKAPIIEEQETFGSCKKANKSKTIPESYAPDPSQYGRMLYTPPSTYKYEEHTWTDENGNPRTTNVKLNGMNLTKSLRDDIKRKFGLTIEEVCNNSKCG